MILQEIQIALEFRLVILIFVGSIVSIEARRQGRCGVFFILWVGLILLVRRRSVVYVVELCRITLLGLVFDVKDDSVKVA